MNLTVQVKNIENALKIANKIASKKTAFPATDYILIEANADNKCRIVATSIENTYMYEFETDVKEAGKAAVAASKFVSLISTMGDVEISLKTNKKESLVLQFGKSKHEINGILPQNFPNVTGFVEPKFKIPVDIFAGMLARASFPVSENPNKPYLDGVNLSLDVNRIILTGTDSARISQVVYDMPEPFLVNFKNTVPLTVLSELGLILEKDQEVGFTADSSKYYFKCGRNYLTSALLSGNFPDCSKLFLSDDLQSLELDTKAFKSALARIMITAEDRKGFLIRLNVKPNEFILTSENTQDGFGEEVLDVNYSGPEFSVAFQGVFLKEFLAVVSSKLLEFRFNSNYTRFELLEKSEKGYTTKYFLIPIRLVK